MLSGSCLATDPGLSIGTGKGEVTATVHDQDYSVVAHSESDSLFTITKDANGNTTRTCSPSGSGGCNGSGSW